VVSGVKTLVDSEADLTVKKSLAQLIASMANENYLCLYGGEALIEFIILTSSISDEDIKKWNDANQKKNKGKEANPDQIITSPEELRSMCDHILSLMTTTIPGMVDALWPYLLEPLTKPKFSSAMAVVGKCIAHISEVKRESKAANYMLDFSHTSNVNLPKPPQIIARLFVLAHLPFRRGSLAEYLLKTLQHLGPMLHPNISNMWDSTIPKMIDYLEKLNNGDSKSEADISKWEGLVRRLLTETIKLINDDMWTIGLIDAVIGQFPLFENDVGVKKVAFKMIGCLLSLINSKDHVKKILEQMMGMVNHNNDEERLGLAQGYGFCSSTHLDIVLEQQTNEIKGNLPAQKTPSKSEKSSGGFFSNLFGGGDKDKKPDPKDKKPDPKSSSSSSTPAKGKAPASGNKIGTLMLTYGYITAYSKPAHITSRLEPHIITHMTPHLETTDLPLQQINIQAMDLIGQSLTPDHLQSDFIFKQRDQFISSLSNYLRLINSLKKDDKKKDDKKKDDKKKDDKKKDESKVEEKPVESQAPVEFSTVTLETILMNSVKVKIAVLALNACTTLLSLEPGLPILVEQDLVSSIAQYYSVQKEGVDAEPKEGEEAVNLDLVFLNLDRLMVAILTKDPSIACLKRLINSITPFFNSPDTQQCVRSLNSLGRLLKKYVDIATAKRPTDRHIEGLGRLLAIMLPRCCDPNGEIRGASLEAIQLLYYIEWMLVTIVEAGDKSFADIDLRPPKIFGPLSGLRKRMIQLEDPNEFFALAHSTLSPLIAKLTSTQELPSLLINGILGLTDSQVTSARGTCVILYGVVSARGPDIKGHVITIVNGLIDKMLLIGNEQTFNGTLHALKSIAMVHLKDTMDAILKQEIPHQNHVVKVYLSLILYDSLCSRLCNYLLVILDWYCQLLSS